MSKLEQVTSKGVQPNLIKFALPHTHTLSSRVRQEKGTPKKERRGHVGAPTTHTPTRLKNPGRASNGARYQTHAHTRTYMATGKRMCGKECEKTPEKWKASQQRHEKGGQRLQPENAMPHLRVAVC